MTYIHVYINMYSKYIFLPFIYILVLHRQKECCCSCKDWKSPGDHSCNVSAVLPLSLLSLQVASVLCPLVFLRQFSWNEVLQIRPVITQELLLSVCPVWGGFRRSWETADVTLFRGRTGGYFQRPHLDYRIATITMSWFLVHVPYHLSGKLQRKAKA